MLWNGLHWPTRMAMLLSSKYSQTYCNEYPIGSRILLRFDSATFASYLFMVRRLSILTFRCSFTTFFAGDVHFVPRVYETEHYLYFFGHEVNPQYSYINSLTRQSHRSFMLRICKNDTGFHYTAEKDAERIKEARRYIKELEEFWTTNYNKPLNFDETVFSYSSEAWRDVYDFPTNHFTSAIKFPFGCYLKRYDGAQSMNTFWGEQNIFYFNRLGKWNLSSRSNIRNFNYVQFLLFSYTRCGLHSYVEWTMQSWQKLLRRQWKQ